MQSLRGHIAYKLLTLLVMGGIVLIIFINYYLNSVTKRERFITKLSAIVVEDAAALPADPKELLNLTDFQYMLKSQVCRKHNKTLLAILTVTSYAAHDELRAAHRQAMPQSKLAQMGLQRVFLLAAIPPTEPVATQAQLKNEQEHFDDLLQGNFQDTYHNLSYKHVMGLRWAANECKRAKFIIKLDDDIIYDVFQLRRYLQALEVQQPKLAASDAFLAGNVFSNGAALRDVNSKWYVSEQEYPNATYPPYLSGWLYLTNPATALRLVNAAAGLPIFWIDDTWVTGIVRERLGIPLQSLNAWYTMQVKFMKCCAQDLKEHNYECEYFVGPNGGDAKLLVEFLHNEEKCYLNACFTRPPGKSLQETCAE